MTDSKPLAHSAIGGIVWVAIEKWLGRILSLVVFAILGRILAPENFGLVALATASAAVIQVFVENGLAQSLVQRATLERRDIDTAFWTSMGIGLALYGVLVAVTPWLASAYDEPQLKQIMLVTGLVLPLSGFASVPAALLARNMKFKKLAARQVGGSVVGAVTAVTLALCGAGIWALVVQPVAISVAGSVILWSSTAWRPRFRWSKTSLRNIWAFSAQVVLIELINTVQSNVDKFIVGAFFGAEVLGYYYIAQRILVILVDVVAAVLGRVSLSTFSRLQDAPERMQNYFTSLTFASALVAFPMFGILVAFGGRITRLLFGPGWEQTVPITALIVPSAMLSSVVFFDKSFLLAKRQGGASLVIAGGQLVFGTVVMLASVPFGVLGVAAGRSIRAIAFWPARIWTLKRYGGLSPVMYLKQFVAPVIATAALIGTGYGLEATRWSDAPLSTISFLVPAVFLTLVVYGLAAWLLARRDIKRLTSVVLGMRKPR